MWAEAIRCADEPSHLLRFYAVECGLKAAVVGKEGLNLPSTAGLPFELRTHDLRRLAKELRISPIPVPEACRRHHDRTATVSHQDVHQAWRYGARLDDKDEMAFVGALEALALWCRGERDR